MDSEIASSAADTQPSAAELDHMGSNDEQEVISGLKDQLNPISKLSKDNIKADTEQMISEEVPKKRSSIRFRRKPKQLKRQHSKGLLFFSYTL